MKRLALAAIRFYQRHLSPHKGFCCAYRVHTGHASCSTLGYRAIRRHGLWAGFRLLRRRLEKCGIAYRRHTPMAQAFHSQAGFCDLSCDPSCDLPCHANPVSTGCDILSNCSPCDCGDWNRRGKKQDEAQAAHIPPKRRRS